jgi:hypothetical protein
LAPIAANSSSDKSTARYFMLEPSIVPKTVNTPPAM